MSVPEQPLNLTAPLRASDPRKDELDPEVGGDLLEVPIGEVAAMIDMVGIRRNAAKTSLQFRLPAVVPNRPHTYRIRRTILAFEHEHEPPLSNPNERSN